MSETKTHSDGPENSQENSSNFDFEQFLQEAESKIEVLKQRRASVTERTQKYESVRNQVDKDTLKDIEISQEIESDLEKLEYELFSEVMGIAGEENVTWKGTGEGFWVFFRYAGIGFIIAVVLHHLLQ